MDTLNPRYKRSENNQHAYDFHNSGDDTFKVQPGRDIGNKEIANKALDESGDDS